MQILCHRCTSMHTVLLQSFAYFDSLMIRQETMTILVMSVSNLNWKSQKTQWRKKKRIPNYYFIYVFFAFKNKTKRKLSFWWENVYSTVGPVISALVFRLHCVLTAAPGSVRLPDFHTKRSDVLLAVLQEYGSSQYYTDRFFNLSKVQLSNLLKWMNYCEEQ